MFVITITATLIAIHHLRCGSPPLETFPAIPRQKYDPFFYIAREVFKYNFITVLLVYMSFSQLNYEFQDS